jgi:hypothetical protein
MNSQNCAESGASMKWLHGAAWGCARWVAVAAIGLSAGSVSYGVTSGQKNRETSQADAQSQKIESVLDRLESKFLDREAAPLTFDEQKTEPAKGKVKNQDAKEIVTVPKREPIEAATPNQKILKDIQEKINEYESQLDSLETDTRKTKHNMIETSVSSHALVLDARLKDSKKSTLQSLTVRLDGSLVYNQVDTAGVWIPTAVIELYHGPVQPGEHKVDVTAVLTRANEQGIPVAGWTPQQVTKSFRFEVGQGRVEKQVTIQLDTTGERAGKALAELMEKAAQMPEMKDKDGLSQKVPEPEAEKAEP